MNHRYGKTYEELKLRRDARHSRRKARYDKNRAAEKKEFEESRRKKKEAKRAAKKEEERLERVYRERDGRGLYETVRPGRY